jgi:membrane protease YdiL (CAAX protease family)
VLWWFCPHCVDVFGVANRVGVRATWFKRYPTFKMVALTIVSIIAAQFFIEWLVSINQQIPLSGSLATLREYQKKAAELTEKLLDHTSFVRFIASAIVIAVIPALAEELFFRGLLLGTMLRSRMNPYVAMAISGFMFSVIHFQFDNVIAIGVLGAFLGFLYYISGSLWLPIIAHFINNFMTVLFKYLHHTGVISQDIVEMNTPWWLDCDWHQHFCRDDLFACMSLSNLPILKNR